MAGIFELKTTAAGKFLFNLKAGNGEVILTSQQYEAKSSAENGIDSVRRNAPTDERFERKTSKAGEPFFVLTATNGQTIGQSEIVLVDLGDGERHRLGQEERARREAERRDRVLMADDLTCFVGSAVRTVRKNPGPHSGPYEQLMA